MSGLTDLALTGSGMKTTLMGLASTYGKTIGCTMAIGQSTIWMGLVTTHTRMVFSIMVNMSWIRNKAMENTFGQMVDLMQAIGGKENNTGLGFTLIRERTHASMAYGRMEND